MKIKYRNGIYDGELKDGVPDGKGTLNNLNGSSYCG